MCVYVCRARGEGNASGFVWMQIIAMIIGNITVSSHLNTSFMVLIMCLVT